MLVVICDENEELEAFIYSLEGLVQALSTMLFLLVQ